ncbi:MAG: [LysW]-lysine hydrolase [bacterium]|nr:[LysW]-lysine hydrolase [bacterium]
MNDSQAIDLLEELVRTPSVSRNETRASELLVKRMATLGFDAEVDEAGNAVGRIGDHGPRIVLLGHIDTVPGEVPVRREGGKLFGRGTVDAKGPLAAFVSGAVRAYASDNLACRVEVVGCVEEEVSSSKGARFRSLGPAPDACINCEPSGWQGVTLGYKGYLKAKLELAIPITHTAGRADGVGARTCRAFVAIEDAASRFNADRGRLYDKLFAHLDNVTIHDNGLEERGVLEIRLRLPEDLGPLAAAQFLAEVLPDWTLSTEGGLAAWSSGRTDPVARLLGRAIGRSGGRPRFLRKTGTSDLNVVGPIWNCPIVAYGPGDSSLDHTPNEHIEIEEYLAGIRVLTGFLTDPNLASLARATPSEYRPAT